MRIFKVSHGCMQVSAEERQSLLEHKRVTVCKATSPKGSSSISQGMAFDQVKAGDLFYLCYSNIKIILLGRFTGKKELLTNGWIEQEYELIREAIPNNGYSGDQYWWTPNDNSTFTEVKNFDAFEKLILQPFFNLSQKELKNMTENSSQSTAESSVSLETLPLKKLFEKTLTIPDYQRIYCWEEKNVNQLLDDIVFHATKIYHLGTIIIHKKDNEFAIVDGQQRLVTLTLLLQELEEEKSKLPLLNAIFYSSEAQSYIAYNKHLIKQFISRVGVEKLKENVKNLQFSVLTLNGGSLDLAYTFFSNQNARGKPLTDYDLLKAHHLRFVSCEKQAQHLAHRWDNLLLSQDDLSEKNLGATFGIYLYRLRKWMRKKTWSEDEKFRVKYEFEATPILEEIPPFGEKFDFYESIQGGQHFFAFADHFIYKYKTFVSTIAYKTLHESLKYESHWWYRDVIETFLFGYYLKFQTLYLAEALFCIERIISQHRYGLGRSSLGSVLQYAGQTEIIMMIDQATSPTFFLAECYAKIDRLMPLTDEQKTGIRGRYNSCIQNMYKNTDFLADIHVSVIKNKINN